MTSTKVEKPLPDRDELSTPFWEASRRHELVLQNCQKCGSYRYPAGPFCPECLSDELEWRKVSGRGVIYTWTVFFRAYHPAFASDLPYAVVVVELEEGPRIISTLVDCKLTDIKIDMPVEVTFEDVSDEISLPKFRPVK